MADGIAELYDVSSNSTRSRAVSSRKDLPERDCGAERDQACIGTFGPRGVPMSDLSLEDTKKMLLKMNDKLQSMPISQIQTRNYVPTAEDISFMRKVFGVPNCSSPWQSKGFEIIIFFFIFIILIGIIFYFGPAFFAGAWFVWAILLIVFIILIFGAQFWATRSEQSAVLCQV